MAVRAMETPMALEEFIMIYNLNSMVRKKPSWLLIITYLNQWLIIILRFISPMRMKNHDEYD
jgi:hypothetical protein